MKHLLLEVNIVVDLCVERSGSANARLAIGLAKTDLLVLDDWGLAPMNNEQRRDLLEILDDRCTTRSTLVTSQLPLERWHDYLADPTLADAILDRLVHAAYKLTLRGESAAHAHLNLDR